MEITVKTKYNKGDKVVVKAIDDSEKLPVLVLAEVLNVKRIVRISKDFNKIAYDVITFNIDKCFSRNLLVEEDQIYSFEEFTKLFNALQPS